MEPTIPRLEDIPNLQQLLESRWAELHDRENSDLFRYRLSIERERVTSPRGFLLQLNPKRTTERRKPDLTAKSVRPPFDPTKFNFNKVDPREVLAEVCFEGDIPVSFLINNSPLTRFHTLVIPKRGANLPQVLTKDGVAVAVRLMLALEDRSYRIVYNSSGALASVNHMHLHLMRVAHKLYVENAPLVLVSGPFIHRLRDTPSKGYCFLLVDPSSLTDFISCLHASLDALLSGNIAHNLMLTWDAPRTSLRVLVYPRLRPCENKQVSPFNVAASELSGFVPLGNENEYESMDEATLREHFREAQGDEDKLYRVVDSLLLAVDQPN